MEVLVVAYHWPRVMRRRCNVALLDVCPALRFLEIVAFLWRVAQDRRGVWVEIIRNVQHLLHSRASPGNSTTNPDTDLRLPNPCASETS